MRIGFDVSKVVPPRDGIGAYGVELLAALGELLAQRQQQHVVRLHGLIEPFDLETARAALGELPGPIEFADCAPLDDDLDLFHATTLAWPTGFEGPVLLTCFDLTFLTHPECHTPTNRLHCIEGMLEAVVNQAQVVAISEATAEQAAIQFGLSEQRLSVIPIAAGAQWSPSDAESALRNLESREVPQRYVLAVGTLEPRKNLARLLEAHAALPASLRAECPLVVVGGSGWRSQDLERRLEESDHVIVLGHVDFDLLRDLYSRASAFVYPSLAEGFGLPILEAMACGAPVICSSISSMPEVAGDAALQVDPLDLDQLRAALERVLCEPGLAQQLTDAGFQRAAAFSWKRTAEETLSLYSRVAGGSS